MRKLLALTLSIAWLGCGSSRTAERAPATAHAEDAPAAPCEHGEKGEHAAHAQGHHPCAHHAGGDVTPAAHGEGHEPCEHCKKSGGEPCERCKKGHAHGNGPGEHGKEPAPQ